MMDVGIGEGGCERPSPAFDVKEGLAVSYTESLVLGRWSLSLVVYLLNTPYCEGVGSGVGNVSILPRQDHVHPYLRIDLHRLAADGFLVCTVSIRFCEYGGGCGCD